MSACGTYRTCPARADIDQLGADLLLTQSGHQIFSFWASLNLSILSRFCKDGGASFESGAIRAKARS